MTKVIIEFNMKNGSKVTKTMDIECSILEYAKTSELDYKGLVNHPVKSVVFLTADKFPVYSFTVK